MDGLVTLRELRARGHKMPVIMCSSLTQRGAKVTIEALACGASDYVAKPAGQASREAALRALAQELIPKIRALTDPAPAHRRSPRPLPLRLRRLFRRVTPPAHSALSATLSRSPAALHCSRGGRHRRLYRRSRRSRRSAPRATRQLSAPGAHRAAHAGAVYPPVCRATQRPLPTPVREAVEGEPVLRRNHLHRPRQLAHGSAGRLAHGAPPTLRLNQGPLENHCRPAVDVLFRSAARSTAPACWPWSSPEWAPMACGCRLIRQQGGSVLAQDQATSTVWGMPGAVTNAGLAHKVLPLDAIAPEIVRLAARTAANRLSRDLFARWSNDGNTGQPPAPITAICASSSSASRRTCSIPRATTSSKPASPSCCATRA